MKVREIFEKSVHFFHEKQINHPRFEAELLLASVLKTDRVGVYLKYETPLNDSEISVLRELVVRKGRGEPTAYLLGEKYFYNRRFEVGPGVLIPRPETEQIVEEVLSFLKAYPRELLRIADLGTGTGCLGITLGLQTQGSEVTLIEQSEDAHRYAQINLQKLIDEKNKDKFYLIKSSVEAFHSDHRFYVIVANPPYIDFEDSDLQKEVRDYEPPEALFASDGGYAVISSWIQFVVEQLEPGGASFFEIGHNQGLEVKKLFQAKGCFQSVEVLQDFNQKDRIIKAVKYG